MRINIIIILLYFVTAYTKSYSQITFSKYYDNNVYGNRITDIGKDFIVLSDSGYLFPSHSVNLYEDDTLGFATTYIQVIRTKNNGDTAYRKLYKKKNHSLRVLYITEANNNNFLLVGHTFDLVKYDKDSTGSEILLVNINANGDTLWTKTVGIGDGDELVTSLVKTRDGGFAIFGQTCDKKETNCDYYLMKVDSNGNKLWHQTYSLFNNSWEMPWQMKETDNGEILLVGYAYAGVNFSYVVKTDSAGNKLWQRSFPKAGASSSSIIDVSMGVNNTYLFSGSIGTGDNMKGWIVRTDTSGKVLMNLKIGATDKYTIFANIFERGNTIYAEGETKEYLPLGQVDGYHTLLYAYTSSGTPLWRRIYSDSLVKNKRYLIYRMKPTPDNGFVMIGFGMDPNAVNPLNNQDVWLLKVDSNGCLYEPCLDMTVGVEANKRNNSTIKIYPNPSDGIIRVDTEEEIQNISIYNLLGQVVFRDNSIIDKEININHLDKGIYIVKIRTTTGLEFSERLIKQ